MNYNQNDPSYNQNNNKTQQNGDASVPRPWTKGIDQNGQAYYVNTETGQIRRQPPVTAGNHQYQETHAFIDPEQWDLVIETMASTIHPQQQLRIFQKLKKIAEKMITKDDPKYRTLYLNNPKLQHTVLAFDGGLEFLYNLGFEPHKTQRDKLVCHEVNARVVQACLICLEDKIEVLTYEEAANRRGSYSEEPSGSGLSSQFNPMQAQQSLQSQQSQHSQQSHQAQQYGQHASYQPNGHEHYAQSEHPQYQFGQKISSQSSHLSDYNNNQYQQPYQQNYAQQNMNNNGFHPHQINPSQQSQLSNHHSDKEQVLQNLGGLGFGTMLNQKPNGNGNKSQPQFNGSHSADPYNGHNRVNPHELHKSRSDNFNYNNNNGHNGKYNQPPSPNRAASRPVPPPPINNHNNRNKQVGDAVIQQNVDNNLKQGNPDKINHVLGLNKYKKMYKTFLFIRHGNSIWNRFKNSGRKHKLAAITVGITEYFRVKNNASNHADTWIVDAPLSRIGIDEAYGLSRFLGRHLTLRQFESLADLEHHQSLAKPIKDAFRIIQTGILDQYSTQLKQISPDLYNKCCDIRNIMDDAHKKIQRIMLEAEAKQNKAQSAAQAKGLAIGHVTKGGDFIPEKEEKDNAPDLGNKSKSNSPVNFKNNSNVLLQHGYDDSFDDEKKQQQNNQKKMENLLAEPDLHRPFSHVVIANQVDKIEEQDDLDMPLEMEWVLDQMIDSSNNSIVVTSNLRRAISTAVIALWDRFGANKECIHILPCLQELGMHVDTHTPILEAQVPEVSNFEKTSKKLNVQKLTEFYSTRLKVEEGLGSFGKKSLRESGSDTQQRLNFFCDWAFKKVDKNGQPFNTIIACGHSHWMRAFFKKFLPPNSSSMASKRKLQNCGVVGFRMICHIGPQNQRSYEIISRSITPIYRGFV